MVYDSRNTDKMGNFVYAGYKNPQDENIKEIQKKFEPFIIDDIEETKEIFTDKYSPVEKFLRL